MVEFVSSGGVVVDLKPNQDLALTLENAFLSSDHIPVAWTTDAEASRSEKNCRLFGYPDAMLFPFQHKEINVEMRINSIPVMLGKLKLIGPTQNALKVSFSGVSIEDSLMGSLVDAPLNKWEFGSLAGDRTLFNEVISGAQQNTREDFALPLMIRESEKDTADDYIANSLIGSIPYESWAVKYLNSPKCCYVTPVVKLKYILQTVFADCMIDEAYSEYLNNLGIIAPYRRTAGYSLDGTYNLPYDKPLNFILDLADSMPDVTVVDFVKDLLSIFCATLYVTKYGKQMISNNAIIQNMDYDDWSGKVADDMEQEFEDGQSYEYGFTGVADSEIIGTITDCQSIGDCLNSDEGTIVRCLATGDIYKKIKRPYIAGHDSGTYYVNGLEIIRQEGMLTQETADKSLDTYSATSGWVPVKSLP